MFGTTAQSITFLQQILAECVEVCTDFLPLMSEATESPFSHCQIYPPSLNNCQGCFTNIIYIRCVLLYLNQVKVFLRVEKFISALTKVPSRLVTGQMENTSLGR